MNLILSSYYMAVIKPQSFPKGYNEINEHY